MAVAINMIRVGLTMKVGVVSKWIKQVGDTCVKGETVAEMETEKLTYDIAAPATGVLLKIVTPENVEVPVGHLLGYIGEAGEAVPEDSEVPEQPEEEADLEAPAAPSKPEKNIRISPLARKLAEEKGVDYVALEGSGIGGRITVQDIENASAASATVAEPIAASAADDFELVPYTGMRKAIGDNMALSWSIAPRVTHHCRANVDKLMALRAELNEGREKADKISVTDMLAVLVAKALDESPKVNVSLSDAGIKRFSKCNIGIAVALDDGLIVPVVHDVCAKSLYEVSAEIKELAGKARGKSLLPEERSGGTFTITNLGMYRSVEFFSPIINQPEAAILGVGKTVETPVAVNGEIIVARLMGLSLTFDHRLIDGSVAAEFLKKIIDNIENPMQSFLR